MKCIFNSFSQPFLIIPAYQQTINNQINCGIAGKFQAILNILVCNNLLPIIKTNWLPIDIKTHKTLLYQGIYNI